MNDGQPKICGLGTCNLTSRGEELRNGYYGATTLKPISGLQSMMIDIPLYCSYTFLGVDGQRILFHVKRLRTGQYDYTHRRCEHGFLRLWDGLRQPGRYPFPPNTLCGDYNMGEIGVQKFSTQRMAEIEFLAQRGVRKSTFTLTYKYVNVALEAKSFPKQIEHSMTRTTNSSVCDWTARIEDCSHGVCDILSPGYPGTYPPNMECQYHIYTADPMLALQFTFSEISPKLREFDIRRTNGCREDFIEIHNGNSSKAPLIGRFCGRKMPDITASGGHLFLIFNTGPDTPPYGHVGFYASAIGLTKEWHYNGSRVGGTMCDWVFKASDGSVSSPDHWLPPSTGCTYQFRVKPGWYLEVVLTVYGLEEACQDKIEVYEGPRMIDKICARNLRSPQPRFSYNLTVDPVKLKYFTTRGQYQSTPDVGFWVAFRHVGERKGQQKPESGMMKDEASNEKVPSTSGSSGSDVIAAFDVIRTLALPCVVLVLLAMRPPR